MSKPIIRIFDIETAPNLAHVWQFWDTRVGVNQVMEDGHIMSFAYKDLGDKYAYYVDNRTGDDKEITGELVKLLDESDIVIAHNGRKFDVGWVRGKAAIHGYTPPSQFRVIDTLIEARKHFFFPSYSLDYLSKVFNLTRKMKHKNFPGHELWVECLKGNPKAWKEMEDYNIQDVFTLEELYLAIRPYITNHPNVSIYSDDDVTRCPKCGSDHINYRGYYYTNLGKYRKFQCQSCGGWGKLKKSELTKDKKKNLSNNGG